MKKIARVGRLILALGLTLGLNAEAFTLGRLTVQSFLGQPLVAEIDVPEISSEEAGSLRVGIANADAFKSAGLDYSATVAELTITGKRRADGTLFLEVRGNKPINVSFVDLVLELNWNAGRMLRDYTVLLDPPGTLNQALIIPSPTLPMVSPSLSDMSVAASPAVVAQVPERNVKAQNQAVELRAKQRLIIKKGDTASAIAVANKAESVSLDQMLVAMLRGNPQAFVDGNVNRLEAGVVMDLPTDEEAVATKAGEAKNIIEVQARDFNEYRRKLANNATAKPDEESSRTAAGKVSAKVQDRQITAPADDRLTLAKPAQPGPANATEDKIAKERAASDAAARADELKKNISDLSKLTSSAPAALLPTPAALPTPATLKPSLLDQALAHPLALPASGGAGLVLLLAALFAARRQRRMRAISLSPTRQPPTDSVLGSMGASQVDMQEELSIDGATAYSSSQISTVTGDVDPIAEADVYLAYKRDAQAEEILKVAKRNNPKRADIQVKLLEIYAKRQDIESFDADAQELHVLTNGEGDDWSKARMLARDIGSAFAGTDAVPPNQSTYSNNSYNNNSLSFVPSPVAANLSTSNASATPDQHAGTGLIDFDLSSLTLDLPAHPAEPEDPKLALAEEYLSIGDKAGARALIEEVIHQNASPKIMMQAQQILARLG